MSNLIAYSIRRFLYLILTIVAVSMVIFLITQVLPGNAAQMILGRYGTEESVSRLAAELGLDRPIYIQYLDWVASAIRGDFGTSLVHHQPVIDLITPRLIRSGQLALLSLTAVIFIATPLGVIAGVKQNSKIDYVITMTSYAGVSMPEFLTGYILIVMFAGFVFQIFPSSGYTPLSEGVISWAKHMILPTISLTVLMSAHVIRQTRSEIIDVLELEYIRTARLKGLGEFAVIYKHALKNALLPTVTIFALNFGAVIGGIVVVEEVFGFPGIGRILVRGIQNRDIPLIQITVLIIAITYAIANFIADIIYTFLDPRIEYGGGEV